MNYIELREWFKKIKERDNKLNQHLRYINEISEENQID